MNDRKRSAKRSSRPRTRPTPSSPLDPTERLEKIRRGVRGWIRFDVQQQRAAWKRGRRFLTADHLREVSYAFDACRESAEKRSADWRLPLNGATLLRAALPELCIAAEQAADSAGRVPSTADVHRKARQTRQAARRTQVIRKHLAKLVEVAPFDSAVIELCSQLDNRLRKLHSRLGQIEEKTKSQKSRAGRKPDVWTREFLIDLAIWWREQGWQPTTSRTGAFMTVANLVVGFRRPNRRRDDRDDSNVLPHVTVKRALAAAEVRAAWAEKLRRLAELITAQRAELP